MLLDLKYVTCAEKIYNMETELQHFSVCDPALKRLLESLISSFESLSLLLSLYFLLLKDQLSYD